MIRSTRLRISIVALAAAGVVAGATTAFSAGTAVKVTATEMKFALSKSSVPKGAVSFNVTNKGAVDHDFKISGKKTAMLKAGKSGVVKVTFAKAGKYAFECTVPGHKAAGMKGTLTVK
jgi:uncharacterized cupredoxin-like copper-binding protein